MERNVDIFNANAVPVGGEEQLQQIEERFSDSDEDEVKSEDEVNVDPVNVDPVNVDPVNVDPVNGAKESVEPLIVEDKQATDQQLAPAAEDEDER